MGAAVLDIAIFVRGVVGAWGARSLPVEPSNYTYVYVYIYIYMYIYI